MYLGAVLLAILGVLFYESIRLYRCFLSNSNYIPDIGFGSKISKILYATVLIVFIIVSIIASYYLGDSDPFNSFLLGVGVPTGSRFITPPNSSSDTHIDDMASDEFGGKKSFIQLTKVWLIRYNV